MDLNSERNKQLSESSNKALGKILILRRDEALFCVDIKEVQEVGRVSDKIEITSTQEGLLGGIILHEKIISFV